MQRYQFFCWNQAVDATATNESSIITNKLSISMNISAVIKKTTLAKKKGKESIVPVKLPEEIRDKCGCVAPYMHTHILNMAKVNQ